MASELYLLREELKEKKLLIKSILNKPESASRDQYTLNYCKFVSQNENINNALTISVPIIDLTETKNSSSFKKIQPGKNKKDIKQIQNVQDKHDGIKSTSAEATLGSNQH